MKYSYICNSTETVINCLLNDRNACICIEDLVVIDYRDLGDTNKKNYEPMNIKNIRYSI